MRRVAMTVAMVLGGALALDIAHALVISALPAILAVSVLIALLSEFIRTR